MLPETIALAWPTIHHLAAIAISRGATLASFDEDFAPFVRHGLRWERLEG